MKHWNKTILCVDDEENIIESYKEILSGEQAADKQEMFSLTEGLKELYQEISEDTTKSEEDIAFDYNLLFARTGEEAVELARKELANGNEIAVGFFDMRLEGKMDGLDVIKEIKTFMPNILCSIVTAYTDRTREQIGVLFDHQDEWIYFNKPFTRGELLQTACHLTSSWNLRKEKEKYLNNLSKLVNTVSKLEEADLLDIPKLKEHILNETLNFLNTKNGLIARVNNNNALSFEIGAGEFKNKDIMDSTQISAIKNQIVNIFEENKITKKDELLIMPITALKEKYLLISQISTIDSKEINLLKILYKNIGELIAKAILSKEAIDAEIAKKESAIKSLRKIASTLCHHINNPLAVIKGFAEITEKHSDTKESKSSIITIQKSCDVIHAIVELLTNLNREDMEKTIDTDIGIQLIDIEKEVTLIKETVTKKYEDKLK